MTRPTSLLPGSPLSGAQLVGDANDWLESLATLFPGTSAPPFFLDNMLWLDTSTTPPTLRQRRSGAWPVFGFGSFQRDPVVINTDWNAVDTEGVSFFITDVGGAAPNAPSTASGWCCMQFRRAGGAKVQIAWRSALDDMRIRVWNGTTWSTWKQMFGQHNILGAVSQASGVPTGAVIESGSNANGFWTKWADGTMICRTPTAGLSSGTSIASGALFQSSSTTTWTFPQTFIAAPVISGSFDTSIKISWLIPDGVGTTSASVRGAASLSFTSGTIFAMAVGRWF